MNKRVTLSDVAEGAGVSRATASAVLSGQDGKSIRVSNERRKQILSVAHSLGYVPNTAAQHLKRGDDNHIIAVFTYENIFPADPKSEYYLFFAGIQREAERDDYDILILNNWAKDKSRSSRIRLASGAIMIGVTRDDEHITSLVKQEFPLVFVGRREIGNALPVHFVTFDYKPAVEEVISLVSRHSDGSIVYVSSMLSTAEPSADKSFFLHEAAEKKQIEIKDVIISDEVSPAAIETVLASRTVIFDRLFIADLFAPVFREKGLVVGRDIFGAILEDDWTGTHPEWTRWSNKRLELGSLAVRHLISSLAGKNVKENFLVDLPVIESDSTAFPFL